MIGSEFAILVSSVNAMVVVLNCTATAFDFPCLAEAFIEAPGGAVAVLGASRAAYALPSRNYNRGFMQAVWQNGYQHLGEIFAQSRLPWTSNAWFDTADHYTHLLYNFLGDPEMVMHTCNPRLHPGQLVYILNHAEDQVVLFDATFAPLIRTIAVEGNVVSFTLPRIGGLNGVGLWRYSFSTSSACWPRFRAAPSSSWPAIPRSRRRWRRGRRGRPRPGSGASPRPRPPSRAGSPAGSC